MKVAFFSLLFAAILGCHLKFDNSFAFADTYYINPRKGDDSNSGTYSSPWKTLKTSISKLKPKDTLYLRGGTYFENKIRIIAHGSANNPITIRNYPGEAPVIDGGYSDFREMRNHDWEQYNLEKKIYRSVRTYPAARRVYGYIEVKNKLYRLVPYRSYKHLSAENEYYTEDQYTYVGAGVLWDSSDERIYIRLEPSKQQFSMGNSISYDLDPRLTKMYLFPDYEVIVFEKGSSYLNIMGICFRFQNNAVEYMSGTNNISLSNLRILGGRTHILVREECYDLVFNGITIEDSLPSWIAWIDVKWGQKPAHAFQGPAIDLKNLTYNIEIKNSNFANTWDGIDLTGRSYNIHIHHNLFTGIRDDAIQLGSGCYDVEIDNNKMLFVSKGVSRHGSGSPFKPGTKWIHHNVIDCSRLMLGGRRQPNGSFPGDGGKMGGANSDGMVWAAPFGAHRGSGVGNGDPWKIYHNTILFGKELNNRGAGHTYESESFYPDCAHEVYNNIFIIVTDHWLARKARVSDGSQIYDGNIYFRMVVNAKKPFFRMFKSGWKTLDFDSLAEFKTSSFFIDSKAHYPAGWENSGIEANPQMNNKYQPVSDGPAAIGAVTLPSDWPGRDGGVYRGALPPKEPDLLEPLQGFKILDSSM